jgi:hypothetical protein
MPTAGCSVECRGACGHRCATIAPIAVPITAVVPVDLENIQVWKLVKIFGGQAVGEGG